MYVRILLVNFTVIMTRINHTRRRRRDDIGFKTRLMPQPALVLNIPNKKPVMRRSSRIVNEYNLLLGR